MFGSLVFVVEAFAFCVDFSLIVLFRSLSSPVSSALFWLSLLLVLLLLFVLSVVGVCNASMLFSLSSISPFSVSLSSVWDVLGFLALFCE